MVVVRELARSWTLEDQFAAARPAGTGGFSGFLYGAAARLRRRMQVSRMQVSRMQVEVAGGAAS
jgi:hypothetical protein